MTHIKSDKLHKAITELNKAIQQNTRFAEGYYQRGNANDETGNSLNAIDDYTQAISINPNFVQALYNRGVVHAKIDLHDFAISDFN